MKEVRITVRLSADLRRRLKDTARRSHVRESDIVREAVERQLAVEGNEMTPYEHAKRAGLIGVVRSAPPDLSTNPKHFDSFGKS